MALVCFCCGDFVLLNLYAVKCYYNVSIELVCLLNKAFFCCLYQVQFGWSGLSRSGQWGPHLQKLEILGGFWISNSGEGDGGVGG